eukprot:GHVQ01011457.1.p1 GENE.GHVQ01011457.1~~GHVQ01011457.1.p1  ORF type:complete len:362 (-),score=8.66 GHVQ01011457.1:269-1354(-)
MLLSYCVMSGRLFFRNAGRLLPEPSGTKLSIGQAIPAGLSLKKTSTDHLPWSPRFVHIDSQFSDGSDGAFKPHPFNRRFAFSDKPLFPIEPRNLRSPGVKRKKKRRGRGQSSGARGTENKRFYANRMTNTGETPLYRRLAKWPEAYLSRQRKTMEPLNISRLRYFIERGHLDTRFPITQRHLHDCRCVKIKNGVRLFNVNDYPFPYKVDIEVAGADQSSIDAIRRVGGSVTVTYLDRVNLRAHVKPYKFDVLPRTARPDLDMVHYLEKMRSRGCDVRYIKPQWLLDEELRIKTQLYEYEAENAIVQGRPLENVMSVSGGELKRENLIDPTSRATAMLQQERQTDEALMTKLKTIMGPSSSL